MQCAAENGRLIRLDYQKLLLKVNSPVMIFLDVIRFPAQKNFPFLMIKAAILLKVNFG